MELPRIKTETDIKEEPIDEDAGEDVVTYDAASSSQLLNDVKIKVSQRQFSILFSLLLSHVLSCYFYVFFFFEGLRIYEGLRALLCLTVYCRDIVLLTVGVYSSNYRVLYTIGICMTRRFQKSVGPSVRLSVCPFVTLTRKKAYSFFIIDSRKIIRISGERVWRPLQENEAIF